MSNTETHWLDPILRAQVLEYLDERRRRGTSLEALARHLGREIEDEDLELLLASLVRSGDAIVWGKRWYAPPFVDLDVGTVKTLERGDAVIRTGAGGEAGLFVRRRNLKGALAGDLVLARQSRRGGRAATGFRLPEAKVVRILSRRWERLVGSVDRSESGTRLVPFDPKLDLDILLEEETPNLSQGDFVVAALVGEPRGRDQATARIVEVLGSPDTPGVDVTAVLRHFDIPDEFPEPVSAQAEALPEDPESAEIEGRIDLRGETIITIDGASARDFDDAISLARSAAGGYELGVHIADVAEYVGEGSALDREAYTRGTSVYFPDLAVPMLPERLSNGLCSLRPGRPRLVLSAFLSFDAEGRLVDRRFSESVIQSTRRMTYAEVQAILDRDPAVIGDVPAEVLELVSTAESLMKKRLARRMERGSIDFDLPEGDVVLDSEGFTVGVRPEQRSAAHRIIEEFMIAANEAVALELMGHERPTLFRIHGSPDARDLAELREVLAELGIDLAGDLEALHPSALQDLLTRVQGRPEESFVSTLVLRAMQRAVYHPESRGHYALSSDHYLHFTSPIRRYPDLLVHRQLKSLLRDHDEEPGRSAELSLALPGIAEHCSETERRAERAERVLLQWKLVRFLGERIGESFRGRITGVQPFGFFVQLTDYYVDGLVPVRSLRDDYYVFEPENHRLVGRDSGRRYRLADEVQVILESVDERRRGLNLAIAPESQLVD